MPVEFDRGSPGKFDSRTLNRKILNRWIGRFLKHLESNLEVVCMLNIQVVTSMFNIHRAFTPNLTFCSLVEWSYIALY